MHALELHHCIASLLLGSLCQAHLPVHLLAQTLALLPDLALILQHKLFAHLCTMLRTTVYGSNRWLLLCQITLIYTPAPSLLDAEIARQQSRNGMGL